MSFEIHKATRQGVLKKPQIAGSKNPRWKGGKITTTGGRVMIHSPNHPYPSKGRYVYRYRLVMEKHIGRYLQPFEIVHHKNGIVNDDRISNLEVMHHQKHSKLHGAVMQSQWARHHDKCTQCGSAEAAHKGNGICTRCHDKNRWPNRKKSTTSPQ